MGKVQSGADFIGMWKKCPSDKTSLGQNIPQTKYPSGKTFTGQHTFGFN